ncbi:MAG: hypothetical protein ACOZAM_01505 [Pseudomonadota bacterium]
MGKEAPIVCALDYLRQRLGAGAFRLADHWEADRLAVGIAHPAAPSRLVYIACRDGALPNYAVILECPTSTDADPPFEECRHFNDLDLDGVASLVAAHLKD